MPTSAAELAHRLGLTFDDLSLLSEALVHSSYVNEHPEPSSVSNERLEFLGDAVLSLIISDELFRRHRDDPEGVLTTRRAAIVSTQGLSRIARRLGIGAGLVLGQGAENSGERGRASVLAGLFEAVIAAVYLDQGLDRARAFVLLAAAPELDAALPVDALKAPKSRLQEQAFAASGRAPSYRVVSSEGPDHDRHFVVEVSIDGAVLGEGEGRSRREAETLAAEAALEVLEAAAAGGTNGRADESAGSVEAHGRQSGPSRSGLGRSEVA